MSNIQKKANEATQPTPEPTPEKVGLDKLSPTLVDALATGGNKVVSFTNDDKGNFDVTFESPMLFGGQGHNRALIDAIRTELAAKYLTIDKDRSSKYSWRLAHTDKVTTGKGSRAASSDELDNRVALMLHGCASYLQGKGFTSPVAGNVRKDGSTFVSVAVGETLAWTAFRFAISDGVREDNNETKVPVSMGDAIASIYDALLAKGSDEMLQEHGKALDAEIARRAKAELERIAKEEQAKQTGK